MIIENCVKAFESRHRKEKRRRYRMDTIVNKISEIETAAVKIMNESALQKKELDEESKQRMDAYDADVDKKTEAKLADIRASLEKEKQAELSSLKEAAARTVLNLEKEYAENHETLAAGILKQMIEG